MTKTCYTRAVTFRNKRAGRKTIGVPRLAAAGSCISCMARLSLSPASANAKHPPSFLSGGALLPVARGNKDGKCHSDQTNTFSLCPSALLPSSSLILHHHHHHHHHATLSIPSRVLDIAASYHILFATPLPHAIHPALHRPTCLWLSIRA